MTNRPKAKGTAFETAVLRYVSAETGQEPYRTALHGNADQGDLHGLTAGRLKVTLECKAYKTYCHADVERWRAETLAERRNAGADVALLVIKQPNVGEKTFWRNRCDVWMPDLMRLLDAYPMPDGIGGMWATLDVGTAMDLVNLRERHG